MRYLYVRALERQLRSMGVSRSKSTLIVGKLSDISLKRLLPWHLRIKLAVAVIWIKITRPGYSDSAAAKTSEILPARGCAGLKKASSGESPAGRDSKKQCRNHRANDVTASRIRN